MVALDTRKVRRGLWACDYNGEASQSVSIPAPRIFTFRRTTSTRSLGSASAVPDTSDAAATPAMNFLMTSARRSLDEVFQGRLFGEVTFSGLEDSSKYCMPADNQLSRLALCQKLLRLQALLSFWANIIPRLLDFQYEPQPRHKAWPSRPRCSRGQERQEQGNQEVRQKG